MQNIKVHFNKIQTLFKKKALNNRSIVSLHEARQILNSLIYRNLHGGEPQ